MPTKPRTAAAAASRVQPAKKAAPGRAPRRRAAPANSKPLGTFARLRAEALATMPGDLTTPDPYVIEDVDPPIEIHAPLDTERQLALMDLFAQDGTFELKDARRILELICGEAFPRVWDLLRGEHISVMLQFITELGDHFAPVLDEGVDVPGGSAASSI